MMQGIEDTMKKGKLGIEIMYKKSRNYGNAANQVLFPWEMTMQIY